MAAVAPFASVLGLGLATGFFLAAFSVLTAGALGGSCAADHLEDSVAAPAIRQTRRRAVRLLETGRITSNLMIAWCLLLGADKGQRALTP